MTETEIMKALECCVTSGDFTKSQIEICSPCPYFNLGDCTGALKANALDLINRKNAEIERFKEGNTNTIKGLIRLQEQIDRVEKEYDRLYKESLQWKAEVERLQKLLDDKCDMCIVRERAEAIKEFAERLKAEKHECGCNFRKKPVYAVTMEKVDQIAKEMGVEL